MKKQQHNTEQKCRLVAQNYMDDGTRHITRKAHTVHCFCQHLFISLTASTYNMRTFSSDISKAYVQSNPVVEHDLYITAPTELCLPPEAILKIVRTLY